MLVRFDEAVGERLRYEVELDELLDARLHLMVLLRTLIQPQHDRRYVAEDGGAHQR